MRQLELPIANADVVACRQFDFAQYDEDFTFRLLELPEIIEGGPPLTDVVYPQVDEAGLSLPAGGVAHLAVVSSACSASTLDIVWDFSGPVTVAVLEGETADFYGYPGEDAPDSPTLFGTEGEGNVGTIEYDEAGGTINYEVEGDDCTRIVRLRAPPLLA